MWRSVCALIAAVWFSAGIVLALNRLVGFGFLALAFVDPDDLLGDRLAISLARRDSERPADD
jgi:hypothetical protein